MEEALTFTDPAGHKISGILAKPDKKTDRLAVLCHGFLSNKNSKTNHALTDLLVPHRIATFRFDFFGQGESEGPFEKITVTTALTQALAALALVKAKGYRKIALVGSSFGGLIALMAAAKWPSHPPAPDVVAPSRPKPAKTGSIPAGRVPSHSLACLALKCPVPDFPEMLNLEFGEAGMAAWKTTDTIPNVVPGGTGRIKLSYGFYEDCTGYDAYAAAKAITAPTLIVQGNADEYVPIHQSRRLSESLGGRHSVVVLPGADHHFSKPEDFREMTTLIAQWVSEHLNAKAS
jgi:pimeloyl-ACP methyl ester carboxylesterase